MSWYSKTISASVRDEKLDQIKNLIDRLMESIAGCNIDKENSKSIVDNVMKRVVGKANRSFLPKSLQEELGKLLTMANETILDSPSKFEEIVYEAVYLLEDQSIAIQNK